MTECMHLNTQFLGYDADGSHIYGCDDCGSIWSEPVG